MFINLRTFASRATFCCKNPVKKNNCCDLSYVSLSVSYGDLLNIKTVLALKYHCSHLCCRHRLSFISSLRLSVWTLYVSHAHLRIHIQNCLQGSFDELHGGKSVNESKFQLWDLINKSKVQESESETNRVCSSKLSFCILCLT